MSATIDEQLTQLQGQQALLTDSLAQMLQNRWTGQPPTLEADLYGLDPSLTLQPCPPLPLSAAPTRPPVPSWKANYAPDTYMPPQKASWTCSACSLAWVLRATGLDPTMDEWQAVDAIGTPENINSTYGLMDASGAALRSVYASYGVDTRQGWLTFDQVWAGAGFTTGQMSGAAWYHWVGIRGQSGSDLWIANSAPGYDGVWDIMTRADFQRLGGFSVVYLVPGPVS